MERKYIMTIPRKRDIALRGKIIYSVYLRNHTEEGTFAALENDLDRIRALGTDVIWLLPIHPIGQLNKKGALGCPYSISDYRGINPEYGTLEDLKHLVGEIHARGMLCIIDVVYNHTSHDSVLFRKHPEYFYRKEDGGFGNRYGDWTDVLDLDYSSAELWDYQIETLKSQGSIPPPYGSPNRFTPDMCSTRGNADIPSPPTRTSTGLLTWNIPTTCRTISTDTPKAKADSAITSPC